jgi:hypothetical protein
MPIFKNKSKLLKYRYLKIYSTGEIIGECHFDIYHFATIVTKSGEKRLII